MIGRTGTESYCILQTGLHYVICYQLVDHTATTEVPTAAYNCTLVYSVRISGLSPWSPLPRPGPETGEAGWDQ